MLIASPTDYDALSLEALHTLKHQVGGVARAHVEAAIARKVAPPPERTPAAPKTRRGEPEHEEQRALIAWAAVAASAVPELALLYAVPNGGIRRAGMAGKLKAEGVKAGVPDLCLPVPRGPYHGLYLELKPPVRATGGKKRMPTPMQRRWLAALAEQGYRAELCYGWEHARLVIERYLALTPAPAGAAEPERGE